ncbi:GNAT family N-acetyltransferase [Nonomuraea sp. SMC257]|uniref:GNAT family N-acetyltransferase n=2 Tax=Nonomuraea montanisoli TaxID=2741721 RepID=A0A7Y6IA53_9ACTN|nr:GNAT family N-acetyltransferase [Nonomuraea montanisoli]
MRYVRIRAAVEKDLPMLAGALGEEPYFVTHLARQRAGHGVLLVAWRAFSPVGHVYLWLAPAEEPEVRDRLPGVPLIVHLRVAPQHRGRRIGSRLMDVAERRLSELGHARVALGVDLDNHRARALYRRRGYRDWPYPPVPTTREVFRPDGRVEAMADVCHILVKDLREAPRPYSRRPAPGEARRL